MFESDILTWITDRNRVDRNEFADRAPINVGHGATIPADRAVRAMLAALRDLEGQAVRRHDWPAVMARRLDLLKDFRRVREQLG